MTKEKYSVVMFSKELAEASEVKQEKAVRMLWSFIAEKKGIKPKGKEHKLAEDFSVFFTGQVEDSRKYADAYGVLFQPEVFRGYVNPAEKRRMKDMGFQTQKLKR